MTWVAFADETAFHTFHDAACAEHDIPRPGRNAATGEIVIDAQWTTAYVAPIDDHGVIKANVPEEDVTTYGLTPTEDPVYMNEDGTPVDDPPTEVTWTYVKDPGTRLAEFMAEVNLPTTSPAD